jgi:hypothetical protein
MSNIEQPSKSRSVTVHLLGMALSKAMDVESFGDPAVRRPLPGGNS